MHNYTDAKSLLISQDLMMTRVLVERQNAGSSYSKINTLSLITSLSIRNVDSIVASGRALTSFFVSRQFFSASDYPFTPEGSFHFLLEVSTSGIVKPEWKDIYHSVLSLKNGVLGQAVDISIYTSGIELTTAEQVFVCRHASGDFTSLPHPSLLSFLNSILSPILSPSSPSPSSLLTI